MADLGVMRATTGVPETLHSTSRKGNTELNMEDFLQLMIVQLQNQTIEDTMDTSEMMNQMVQMQMISALTNMTEASIMGYASSLVGKEVTIGIMDGNQVIEKVVTVTGTGTSDGEQVLFCTDENGKVETYHLNQVMAVGKLPPKETVIPGTGTTPGTGTGTGTETPSEESGGATGETPSV